MGLPARHQIVRREGVSADAPGGSTVACECGVQGTPAEIAEHVRRYARLVEPSAIKVGTVRNGHLTRTAERTHFEIEDLEGRTFVLVVLSRSTAPADALRDAAAAIATVIAGSAEP